MRGLKSNVTGEELKETLVAPYMGAWIEIYPTRPLQGIDPVAPYMGAWIEILLNLKAFI